MWRHFTIAVSFLTLFRLPGTPSEDITPSDLAASFAWFPAVGLLLGTCLVVVASVLQGAPPFLLAVVLTALLAVLTRGLHLDGLADLTDGIGGGYTPERRLEIMKDSRVGAFGVLALIFAVLFKVAAIYSLILGQCWTILAAVPVASRFAMVLGACNMVHARSTGGLARPFLECMNRRQLLEAFLACLAILVLLVPRTAVFFIILAAASSVVLRIMARRSLGGMTGDVLGALNEITEIILLAVFGCFCGHRGV